MSKPNRSTHRTQSKQKKSRLITVADLFSGAGGFSLAASNLNLDIRVAIENDPNACQTYRANLLNAGEEDRLIEEDISKIELEKIGNLFGPNRRCDLVLGGPPCQGFSVHRIKGAGVEDPRNSLIHRYFEIVDYLNPSLFLMENVPGILWPRHAKYLDLFYKMAKSSGYRLSDPLMLDARDYGVPQRRKRIFILGVKQENPDVLNWPPPPTHGNPSSDEFDESLFPWVSSRIAFRKALHNDPNDIHMKHGNELIEAFKNTPIDGGSRRDSGRVLKCHKNHDGHKDVYGRIDRRKPAPTMTTACVNPSKGRFVHPTRHHGITVRQAARIQSFPDEFVFHGGLMSAARQIGNAVPISLGEAVLSPLKAYLMQHPK